MLSHSVVIFLSGDPPTVFRTSLIFLGFMRFGANETHEMTVCFFFFRRCVVVAEGWSRSHFSKTDNKSTSQQICGRCVHRVQPDETKTALR